MHEWTVLAPGEPPGVGATSHKRTLAITIRGCLTSTLVHWPGAKTADRLELACALLARFQIAQQIGRLLRGQFAEQAVGHE